MTQFTANFFSRSTVAMCAVVLLAMGVFGAMGVERAYAITNIELVNLFIALEIIPEENAEHAHVVVAGQDGELSSSDLTELLIALEIIPEEKVEQARAVVTGAGTTGAGPYTPPGGLYIEPVRTDAVLLQYRFVERGKYTVTFDITAAEDTFYMSVDPDKSLRYFVEGGIYGALGPSSDQQHVIPPLTNLADLFQYPPVPQ